MTTKVLNLRQVWWAESLALFHFWIECTPGKSNAQADILSRWEQDMANLWNAQVDNCSWVMLGPPRLDPYINSELAEAYLYQLPDQTVTLNVISSVDKTISLDSF
jgi:hypothetical protein